MSFAKEDGEKMQREVCEEIDGSFSVPSLGPSRKDAGLSSTHKLDDEDDAAAGADVARARWTLLRQVNTRHDNMLHTACVCVCVCCCC